MEHYFNTIWDSIRFSNIAMPSIGIRDILDIVIVAYLIYKMIFWIKETRAWVLFKGILVICIFALMCYILRLNTILWILSNIRRYYSGYSCVPAGTEKSLGTAWKEQAFFCTSQF